MCDCRPAGYAHEAREEKKINGKGKDTEKRDSEREREWESVLRFDTKPIALCKRFDRIMSRELLIYALPFVLACVCVCLCVCVFVSMCWLRCLIPI